MQDSEADEEQLWRYRGRRGEDVEQHAERDLRVRDRGQDAQELSATDANNMSRCCRQVVR
jgi:hypothetical protein